MNKIRVSNMESERSGRPVANQFVITYEDSAGNYTEIFQSYRTVIAKVMGEDIILDENWNYSNTTRKYLYQFLSGSGHPYCNKASVLRKIEEGIFKIDNLN